MPFAVASGRVFRLAIGHFADLAAINPLAFRGKPPIAPHLLVVAEAEPPGNLDLSAALNLAPGAAFLVFPLRSQATMAANLLVVARAISSSSRLLSTPFCLA